MCCLPLDVAVKSRNESEFYFYALNINGWRTYFEKWEENFVMSIHFCLSGKKPYFFIQSLSLINHFVVRSCSCKWKVHATGIFPTSQHVLTCYCKETTQFQISLPLVNLATLFQAQIRRNVMKYSGPGTSVGVRRWYGTVTVPIRSEKLRMRKDSE
jgi:hypothetical protein